MQVNKAKGVVIFDELEQGTEEWFDTRLGVITGTKSGEVYVEKNVNKTELVSRIIESNVERLEIENEDPKEFKKALAQFKKDISALSQFELEEQAGVSRKEFYKAQKKGYWKLMAEKLGYKNDEDEDDRDRGHRLEPETREAVSNVIEKEIHEVGMIKREDNEYIGISPDGVVFTPVNDEVEILEATEFKALNVANHLEFIHINEVPSKYEMQVVQYFVVIDTLETLYFASYNPNVTAKPLHIVTVKRKDVEKAIAQSLYRQTQTLENIDNDIISLTF